MEAQTQPVQDARLASGPLVLAVCGDPVIGRAVALLLPSPRYDARFLSASSLSDPGSLECVRLLLVTPIWESGAERREALFMALRGASDAVGAPILELTSSRETRNGEARVGKEHVVSWPCTPKELERRIEAILLADSYGSNGLARSATLEG